MKRFLLFFFISFLFSSCFLSLDRGPIPNMKGIWMVKNGTNVNIELFAESIRSAHIAPGDSLVFFMASGPNTYTPPFFEDFLSVGAIALSVVDSDGSVSDSNCGIFDLKHRIFDVTSWKCYRNDIGEPTWVFGIIEQDISSLRGVDGN